MTVPALLADRRLWIGLAVVALVVALRLSGLAEHLSLDTLRTHREVLTRWVEHNAVVAAPAFVAVYAAVVAMSLPGAVFLTLSGGFLFGTALGTLLTVIGATTGATVVFLLAKALLGERALDRFGDKAGRLGEIVRRNAFAYLLALRLVPLFPFFLVNLVPAFVGVRLPVFVITTFVGIIPGTVVFSLAGAGLGSVLDRGGELSVEAILTPEIVAGLAGLAVLSLVSIPVRRWLARGDTPPEPAGSDRA